jgi:hypothetical protein
MCLPVAACGEFYHLALAVGSRVLRNACGTIEHSHRHIIGDQRQQALSAVRRHRVAVGVETDEGLSVGFDGLDAVGVW